jgi:hypothetical protein
VDVKAHETGRFVSCRRVLRYKITPPVVERSVPRPRLLDAARAGRCTVLAAPAGHGKTCLASQLAEALPGPAAWFSADELDRDLAGVAAQLLAALGRAWPDLADLAPATVDDDAALPLLASAMETLAGPGCLVIDDAHRLPPPVLDAVARTAVDALPAECRLVVCTRHDAPEPLVRAEAAGLARTIGPGDLVFTAGECAALHTVDAATGAELHARTGGWPLAVALSAEALDAPPPAGHRLRHGGVLTELALGDLPAPARALLATLARLPRFPAELLAAVGADARVAIEAVARRHPSILEATDDGWWVVREWLRDALGTGPAAPEAFAAVAASLGRLGQRELLVHLLLSDGRHAEAVDDIERLATEGASRQRWGWVRALIAGVPRELRTLELDLLALRAAHSLNLVEGVAPAGPHTADVRVAEAPLLDLVERTTTSGSPAQALRARALLADHYRWTGDVRVLDVCDEALGDVLTGDEPGRALSSRAARWSPDEAEAAATMLRLYGLALVLADDGAVVARGRRLLAAAMQLIGAHRGNLSERLWLTYVETMTWLRPAAETVQIIRPGARRMQELHQFDAGLRLAELAVLEHFAGEAALARHTVEVAEACADESGHTITDTPLAAIAAVLDITEHGLDDERAARFDAACDDLADHPRLRRFVAPFGAELAVQLVWQGDLVAAERYLERAEDHLVDSLFAHAAELSCRRARALLRTAGGDPTGLGLVDELRASAEAEGRSALVEQLDADRARLALAPSPLSAAGVASAPTAPGPVDVAVRVLGPVLGITIAGEPAPAPRGYPAKLLALLIAADGIMTVDAAIEGLWPGADPDLGRNRLYGVLLRLRRGLGLPVDGPVTCIDGLVRLEAGDGFTVDAWAFEHAVRHRADPLAVALLYTGDVLSEQFAYDDAVEAYRAHLRRRFLDVARVALRGGPGAAAGGVEDDPNAARRAELARRVERCSA